eukprot:7690290-Pyramimonas_sp.AAC.1
MQTSDIRLTGGRRSCPNPRCTGVAPDMLVHRSLAASRDIANTAAPPRLSGGPSSRAFEQIASTSPPALSVFACFHGARASIADARPPSSAPLPAKTPANSSDSPASGDSGGQNAPGQHLQKVNDALRGVFVDFRTRWVIE